MVLVLVARCTTNGKDKQSSESHKTSIFLQQFISNLQEALNQLLMKPLAFNELHYLATEHITIKVRYDQAKSQQHVFPISSMLRARQGKKASDGMGNQKQSCQRADSLKIGNRSRCDCINIHLMQSSTSLVLQLLQVFLSSICILYHQLICRNESKIKSIELTCNLSSIGLWLG